MVDSLMTYILIGYTTNTNNIDIINSNYDSTLGNWIETNKIDLESNILSISEFFNSNPKVYIARTSVSLIDNLPEITDIYNLYENITIDL